jgi:hypothetical protein
MGERDGGIGRAQRHRYTRKDGPRMVLQGLDGLLYDSHSIEIRCRRAFICEGVIMTKDQVKEILDRVLTWPPQRQADVAHLVELMEQQDSSALRLTKEQLAEVRRRRAKKNPK